MTLSVYGLPCALRVETRERKRRVRLEKVLKQEKAAEAERQRRIFVELDWFADPPPVALNKPASPYVRLSRKYHHETLQIADPTISVIIDEADRLKMTALEQARDIFDKGGIGVVFIGMPGIEKRLSRYPQLYSRVGLVHVFHPPSAAQVRELLHQKWLPSSVALPGEDVTDEEALAVIIRVTGGNLR
jgi:hypothetical protein